MKAISRAEAPVAIEGDGVELRMQKLGGGMTTPLRTLPGERSGTFQERLDGKLARADGSKRSRGGQHDR